jgi:phosphoribosylanthranilate isomerase
MNTKVKICGVRTLDAANVAVNAGADCLGFNFVGSSKRRIDPQKAKEIINHVKDKIKVVGVFQNDYLGHINTLVKELQLDFVQLHGAETPEYAQSINCKVIKTVTLSETSSTDELISNMQSYKVDYFLLDRETQGKGKMVNSKNAKMIAEKFPIFLAGGLSSDNVANIVKEVKPYAVDVAGGIETNGAEDLEKIKKFIEQVKGVTI